MADRVVIFISHIAEESGLARLIKEQVESDFLGTVSVFVSSDGADIALGKNWLDEVSSGLRRAQLMLVLCSPLSVGRPWVQFESGAGWVQSKFLVPVCHSGTRPDSLPIPLRMLQGFVATNAEAWRSMYSLIAAHQEMRSPAADLTAFTNVVHQFETDYATAVSRLQGREKRLQYRAAFYLGDRVERELRENRPHIWDDYDFVQFQPNVDEFFLHVKRRRDQTPFSASYPVEVDWPDGSTAKYVLQITDGLIANLQRLSTTKDASEPPSPP